MKSDALKAKYSVIFYLIVSNAAFDVIVYLRGGLQ